MDRAFKGSGQFVDTPRRPARAVAFANCRKDLRQQELEIATCQELGIRHEPVGQFHGPAPVDDPKGAEMVATMHALSTKGLIDSLHFAPLAAKTAMRICRNCICLLQNSTCVSDCEMLYANRTIRLCLSGRSSLIGATKNVGSSPPKNGGRHHGAGV